MKIPEELQNAIKGKTGLISVIIVGIGVLFAFRVYKHQAENINRLNGEIAIAGEKISLGRDFADLDEKITRLRAPFTRGKDLITIDKFNQIASEAKVKIVSIIPETEKKTGFYTSTLFILRLRADYNGGSEFLKKLESLPGLARIEEFNIKAVGGQAPGVKGQGDDAINMLEINIRVNCIFFANEI